MNQHYSRWRKSSYSNPSTECIEVGRSSKGTIGVRDTRQIGVGPVLDFTPREWLAFIKAIRSSDS
ncbi:hypothetical protein GCM10022254_76110 [Actinomadura meridiana]|uniref:DUF397 domain-containing protein n=1 Tax=Actinomadura meridiana TaxID=559626 RepID=A0ABP8CRW2_9ACTN